MLLTVLRVVQGEFSSSRRATLMEHDMASSTKVDIEVDGQADSWLAKLGPGLITGAADDDPSGIATYSQAGAQFGFNMLWTVLLTYPLMVAIQVVSARIGRVSGHSGTNRMSTSTCAIQPMSAIPAHTLATAMLARALATSACASCRWSADEETATLLIEKCLREKDLRRECHDCTTRLSTPQNALSRARALQRRAR